ncbi:MAG: RNA polymerase sigma-70 factor (ECF subfamily) [Candidatus Paceibacteria bacterium]|jgi:RNA polymerase sigma-70 factor (ECF subfamily)
MAGSDAPMTDSQQELTDQVYAELHAMASRKMLGERRDHTLQPTALVNEAYLRMAEYGDAIWSSRGRFRAIAATCIRLDHARRKGTAKRGGNVLAVRLADLPDEQLSSRDIDVLELEEVLEEPEQRDPVMAH